MFVAWQRLPDATQTDGRRTSPDGRVASLCVLRQVGRVGELAGLGPRRSCGSGEDLLGLRFVHHRAPPTENGLDRNGVNLISLLYNIGWRIFGASTML